MPHALDWDKLKTFHAAAQTGSLTAAADKLRISQSAVSRQITALEDYLEMPLFHRHARGLTLTEQGHILFKTADDVSVRIARVQSQVIDSRQKPQGVLRVSTPISLGSNWLPSVIERKLGQITQSLYASHKYLSDHGAPSSVEDLDNHRIVAFGDLIPKNLHSANWVLNVGRGPNDKARKPVLVVNNLHGIMRAAEAGIGIVGIPDYMTVLSKRLVRVLPTVRGEEFDLYFVYPTELRGSVRAKVFREFLTNVTKDWPNF